MMHRKPSTFGSNCHPLLAGGSSLTASASIGSSVRGNSRGIFGMPPLRLEVSRGNNLALANGQPASDLKDSNGFRRAEFIRLMAIHLNTERAVRIWRRWNSNRSHPFQEAFPTAVA